LACDERQRNVSGWEKRDRTGRKWGKVKIGRGEILYRGRKTPIDAPNIILRTDSPVMEIYGGGGGFI